MKVPAGGSSCLVLGWMLAGMLRPVAPFGGGDAVMGVLGRV